MRVGKNSIHLSPGHPSLLLNLPVETAPYAPVVIDPTGTLIDGYRRYQLQAGPEIEAVPANVANIFEAALAMNQRTRTWDDLDCFLWDRWARSLGVEPELKVSRFPAELKQADDSMLRLLAERKLTLRQAVLILQSPLPYRPFFQRFLHESIRINNNETAAFIHMSIDLKKSLKAASIEQVVARVEGDSSGPDYDPRRRGERLLKGMRVLRYPYYQRKLNEFDSSWRELQLGREVQADRSHFLERGKLELTLTSSSLQEMKEILARLMHSVESPLWRKIWEE